MRVFPLRQQSFSPKSFPSEESNKKYYELRRHVTDALLRSLNLQLLPRYFLCLVRYVTETGLKETFLKTATLTVLVWAYPREM